MYPSTHPFRLYCSFLSTSNQSTYLDDFSFVSKFMQPCVKSSEFVDIVLIFSPYFSTIFFCCRCYHHLGKKLVCLCIFDLSKLVVSKELVGRVCYGGGMLLLLALIIDYCVLSMVDGRKGKYNVIKMFLGASFLAPQIPLSYIP
jgi:hypothetical protein